jgi:hypothetical protein
MPSREEESEAKIANKFAFSLNLHYICRPNLFHWVLYKWVRSVERQR